MAGITLLIAALIEVAFAAYCIIARSSQRRLRNWIRIGAFAVFLLLTVLSVIQWSFRWYALAALLLIWAIVGAVRLLRPGGGMSQFKAGAIIGRLIGTLLLVSLALVPAFTFPQHKSPRVTGPHPVATFSTTYTDPDRIDPLSPVGAHRFVNVTFWYPVDGGGKYPLVVFSHGAMGIRISNSSTFTELASHGYVVCSIDHPHDALFTRGPGGRMVTTDPTFRQEIVGINNGSYTEAEVFQLEQTWMQVRMADIHLVIDSILQNAAASSGPVYDLVDTSRIGLMGHSLGGISVAQLARQRSDIGAVVVLDADLQGEYVSYSNGKYTLNSEVYPVPLLVILADDVVHLIDRVPDAADTVAVMHVTATAPHAHLVHIRGTDHQSVTDLPLVSPFLASMIGSLVPRAGGGASADRLQVIETMNDLVLRFFDAYLKGNGTFSPAATY